MADQGSLLRYASPDSVKHDDGIAWRCRQFLEGGSGYDPNAKHRQSLNKQWREEQGK